MLPSAMKKLTQTRLKELLHYDPKTGIFTRSSRLRGCKFGSIAGHVRPGSYVLLFIDRSPYYAHRLAFLYMSGSWPEHETDHIDGNRSNNAWANLRDVRHTINTENQRRAKANSSSRVLGAFPSRDKWISRIVVRGTTVHLGTFRNKEDAGAAYTEAKRRLHQGCTI